MGYLKAPTFEFVFGPGKQASEMFLTSPHGGLVSKLSDRLTAGRLEPFSLLIQRLNQHFETFEHDFWRSFNFYFLTITSSKSISFCNKYSYTKY